MYRTLMVPLDGSVFGEHAIAYAISIAKRANAVIQLAHVYHPIMLHGADVDSGLSLGEADATARKRAQQYLVDTAERIKAVAPLDVEPVLLDGRTGSVLVDHAVKAGVDLIVMTTHGRGPLSQFWLGSVADELARTTPMPVILIRPVDEQAPAFAIDPPLRRILAPLDGSPLAEQVLEPLLRLGTLVDAEYRLVRVVEPVYSPNADTWFTPPRPEVDYLAERRAREYLDQVRQRLQYQATRVDTYIDTHSQPAEVILEEARRYQPDLIALATHGRSGLVRQVLGSVADKVLRGGTVPVFVHRPHKT